MDLPYFKAEAFQKHTFSETPLPKGEYEQCKFSGCDFSNSNLSGNIFSGCEFISCNLSLAKLSGTALREIVFKDSKLLGLHFEQCNGFGLSFRFENCALDHSSFFKTKIRETIFHDCQLKEVDFSECDLSGSVFKGCDLHGARFDNTNLEKADLRTAYGFSIDPDRNRIRKARFSLAQLAGLLDKYDIEIEK